MFQSVCDLQFENSQNGQIIWEKDWHAAQKKSWEPENKFS